jgi:glycosyltransferase involved in cell wall biosynthesis
MKLSIIFPVLNSHEIVRRQVLHFKKMNLSDDVEIIFVDDGSDPPLDIADYGLKNLRIYATNDTRPWTWALARNAGARLAQGEYLLMADIDYIIPQTAIGDALLLDKNRMNFQREFGILDENGDFTQDIDALRKYGLLQGRIDVRGVKVSAHTNDFVMRRSTYFQLGGYREDCVGRPYPQGEDRDFQRKWINAIKAGKVNRTDYRPMVFMFPNGKFCGDRNYNPFGLFHNLSRKNA